MVAYALVLYNVPQCINEKTTCIRPAHPFVCYGKLFTHQDSLIDATSAHSYCKTNVIMSALSYAASPLNKLFVDNNQSTAYAVYRPNYENDCPEVYDQCIFQNLSGTDLAIDIATGTGQAVGPLASRFKKVIGKLTVERR